MNIYLLSLIGLLVILGTGSVFFGLINKAMHDEAPVPLTPGRFIIAGIGMYVIAYAFTLIFQNTDLFGEGVAKGMALGALVGVAFAAIPFFADAPYLRGNDGRAWVVMANWTVALILLGAVVGWLA